MKTRLTILLTLCCLFSNAQNKLTPDSLIAIGLSKYKESIKNSNTDYKLHLEKDQLDIRSSEIFNNLFPNIIFIEIYIANIGHSTQTYYCLNRYTGDSVNYLNIDSFNKLCFQTSKKLMCIDKAILYLLVNRFVRGGMLSPLNYKNSYMNKSYFFEEYKKRNYKMTLFQLNISRKRRECDVFTRKQLCIKQESLINIVSRVYKGVESAYLQHSFYFDTNGNIVMYKWDKLHKDLYDCFF